MAYRYETKRVVQYYHNGKRVLYKYHKVGNTSQLVYSAYAYGGYVKNGLLMQLDCSQNIVANAWTDLVGGQTATLSNISSASSDGIVLTSGSSITLPSVDNVAYYEVTTLGTDGVLTTQVTATLPSTYSTEGTLYSIRAYSSALTQTQKERNEERDIARFDNSYADGVLCLGEDDVLCLGEDEYLCLE